MAAKFQYSFKDKNYDPETATESESFATESEPERSNIAEPEAKVFTQPYTSGGQKLEPLEGREADIKFTQPHEKHRKKIASRVAQSSKSDEHIISVPEVAGSLHSKPGVPYADSLDGGGNHIIRSSEVLDTVIYFEDKEGIILRVEDGQNAEAGELFEMVMDETKFPEVARQAFSLWLVSDNLELQLKPNHVPFKLAAYWEELLEKYTSTSEADMERDEPVLMFRKNVFFNRNDEAMIMNADLIKLLYHEQNQMVVDGRYPLSMDQCVFLAGIQALLEHKGFNRHDHTPEYYREKVAEYFPKHYAKRSTWNKLFKKEDNPEYKLADAHQRAFEKYGDPKSNTDRITGLHNIYLQFLRKQPYYGAAFFRGQIEQPGKPILFDKMDNPVFIAVNTEGVFIIDMDDDVFLFGLLYRNMAWNYAEPRDASSKTCMPCIFFQFTDTTETGKQQKAITQVFTKEAKLIDLLMLSCLELNKDKEKRGQDLVKIEDLDCDGVIEGRDDVWAAANRLCIAHYDEKSGRFVDAKNIKKINKLTRPAKE